MDNLENYITLKNLEIGKKHLVPHIFSQNYFNILKTKIEKKKLSENEKYYYNHFIKKKLLGMMELLEINSFNITGKDFIIQGRMEKAIKLLKKYKNRHKNMKMLISGSFLYNKTYNDIDIFIISKYNKEDYRENKIHINYLPEDIEKTLFFKSISAISIADFKFERTIPEKFPIEDLLHLYEVIILLIMQRDSYIQELREFILLSEYLSHKVILNSMQLKIITDSIIHNKSPIKLINKIVVASIVSLPIPNTKNILRRFMIKNSSPERGSKIYKNWKIYNQVYKEALEIVAS